MAEYRIHKKPLNGALYIVKYTEIGLSASILELGVEFVGPLAKQNAEHYVQLNEQSVSREAKAR